MKYVKELNESYKMNENLNIDNFTFNTNITNIKQVSLFESEYCELLMKLDKKYYDVDNFEVVSCDINIQHHIDFDIDDDGIQGIEYEIDDLYGEIVVSVPNYKNNENDDFTIYLNDIEHDTTNLKINENGKYVIDEIEIDFKDNVLTLKNNFNED